jgi:LPXTG-motif cell wall-anchored protein
MQLADAVATAIANPPESAIAQASFAAAESAATDVADSATSKKSNLPMIIGAAVLAGAALFFLKRKK